VRIYQLYIINDGGKIVFHIRGSSQIILRIAEKRRKALQERRVAREKAIDETLNIWERDILPDWRVVNKNASLRKLWWKGVPEKLRAQLWQQAVGNGLALSKGPCA
jgi:hypothetical protein